METKTGTYDPAKPGRNEPNHYGDQPHTEQCTPDCPLKSQWPSNLPAEGKDAIPYPTVESSGGYRFSGPAVDQLLNTNAALLAQRNRIQLELDQLKGKLHLLDREYNS